MVIASQIHGFTIDYSKFILIKNIYIKKTSSPVERKPNIW